MQTDNFITFEACLCVVATLKRFQMWSNAKMGSLIKRCRSTLIANHILMATSKAFRNTKNTHFCTHPVEHRDRALSIELTTGHLGVFFFRGHLKTEQKINYRPLLSDEEGCWLGIWKDAKRFRKTMHARKLILFCSNVATVAKHKLERPRRTTTIRTRVRAQQGVHEILWRQGCVRCNSLREH